MDACAIGHGARTRIGNSFGTGRMEHGTCEGRKHIWRETRMECVEPVHWCIYYVVEFEREQSNTIDVRYYSYVTRIGELRLTLSDGLVNDDETS